VHAFNYSTPPATATAGCRAAPARPVIAMVGQQPDGVVVPGRTRGRADDSLIGPGQFELLGAVAALYA